MKVLSCRPLNTISLLFSRSIVGGDKQGGWDMELEGVRNVAGGDTDIGDGAGNHLGGSRPPSRHTTLPLGGKSDCAMVNGKWTAFM